MRQLPWLRAKSAEQKPNTATFRGPLRTGARETPALERVVQNRKIVDLLVKSTSANPVQHVFEVRHGESSASGELIDPFDVDEEEEEVRWLLEDHATRDPLNNQRSSNARRTLYLYGQHLFTQIRQGLITVLGCSKDIEGAQQLDPIYLRISTSHGDRFGHGLHWESLALLEDCDINIVRIGSSKSRGSSSPQRHISISSDQQDSEFRILFLTARSVHGPDRDVPYRLVSRIVGDTVTSFAPGSRVPLSFVRPGTWSHLENALETGHFDMVHLDVHGKSSKSSAWVYLMSSDDPGSLEKVKASTLGSLLAKNGVQTVILNACNSASSSHGTHSNLAFNLIEHGVKHVVAMAYDLLISSAVVMIPTLYENLLDRSLSLADAVHQTRRRLAFDKTRISVLKTKVEVPDAVVVTLYQNEDVEMKTMIPSSQRAKLLRSMSISSSNSIVTARRVVIGRELDLLQIETALTLQSNALMLLGPIGGGKTAFMQYAAQWWRDTRFVESFVWIDGGIDDALKQALTFNALRKRVVTALSELKAQRNSSAEDHSHPRAATLLVIDHVEQHLAGATIEQRKELSNMVTIQKQLYVVFIFEQRRGPWLDLFPHHLCALSDAATTEMLLNTSASVGTFDNPTTHYLQNVTELLAKNPLAIQLASRSLPSKKTANFKTLVSELLRTKPTARIVDDVSGTHIAHRVKKIFVDLTDPVEEKILLSFSQARSHVEVSGKTLIKALAHFELITVASEYSDYVYGMLRELKKDDVLVKRDLIDFGLSSNPCTEEYKSVLSKLEEAGLVDIGSEIVSLHPLLPFALLGILRKGSKQLQERLSRAFLYSYQLGTRSWSLHNVPDCWYAAVQGKPADTYLPYRPSDFANHASVLQEALRSPKTSWFDNFPWRLLIWTGIGTCTISETRAPAYQATVLTDYLREFLHEWNKYSPGYDFALGANLHKEERGTRHVANEGAEMGAITACWVSALLFRQQGIGYGHSEMQQYFNETVRLWMRMVYMIPRILSNRSAMEFFGSWCFLRGFASCAAGQLGEQSVLFRQSIVHLNKDERLYDRLQARFEQGYREGEFHMRRFSPLTANEVEDLWLQKLEDTRMRDEAPSNKEKIANLVGASAESFSYQSLGTNDVSSQLRKIRDEMQTSRRPVQRATLTENRRIIGDVLASQSEGDANKLISRHLQAAQRLSLGGDWADAVVEFEKARTELLKLHPGIDQPKAKTREKDGGFLASILLSEAGAYYKLEKREECTALCLQARALLSFPGNNPLQRYQLGVAYERLCLLDKFPVGSLETRAGLSKEQIEWLVEWGCLQYDSAPIGALETLRPAMDRIFDVSAGRLEGDDGENDDAADEDYSLNRTGYVFSTLYLYSYIRLDTSNAGRAFSESLNVRKEVTDFKSSCMKQMRVSHKALQDLLESVTRVIFVDIPFGERSGGADEVFQEAERVLFGTVEDCRTLTYFPQFEGKPIRRKLPWITTRQWIIQSNPRNRWLQLLESSNRWDEIRAAKT